MRCWPPCARSTPHILRGNPRRRRRGNGSISRTAELWRPDGGTRAEDGGRRRRPRAEFTRPRGADHDDWRRCDGSKLVGAGVAVAGPDPSCCTSPARLCRVSPEPFWFPRP
jgi:hypothetical protein